MKEIKEELNGAEHYAKRATQYKEEDQALSRDYADMASQELTHVDKLHNQAVRIIQAYRAEHGAPPEAMLAVWNWEHEAMMDHTAKVKALLSVYRGN